MKRILVTLTLLLSPLSARAQNFGAVTVASCGTPGNSPVVGNSYPLTMDPTGKLCTSSSGSSAAQQTYTLASAQLITAGSNSTPVTVTTSATYGWSYILSGTSPSVTLQVLGPDGTTWQTVGSPVTASGMQGVVIFAGVAGASVRLLNSGSNSVTITSKLVS
jgi:hypothetical protein